MSFAKISSKLIICFLTFLFWGVSAGLCYLGVNMIVTYERYEDILTYLHSIFPAIVILAVAFLMFIIGVIGLCALFSENRCLLATYFSLLAVIVLVQGGALAIVLLNTGYVNILVRGVFKNFLEKYGLPDNKLLTQNFDYIQHKFQCCGEINNTDWKNTWWFKNAKDRYGNVPQSCCVNYIMNMNNSTSLLSDPNAYNNQIIYKLNDNYRYCKGLAPEPRLDDNYYVHGCYIRLRYILQSQYVYIAGVLLAVLIIQFVALISTCILMICRDKLHTQTPPYINIATHEDAHYNL